MTKLPWDARGARLHLPRDLQVAYTVGRMGVVTTAHVWPLFWGSPNTARFGFGRLLRLGLLRTFEREDPSRPAWYALAKEAAGWVADEIGCEDGDLRCVTGIRRMNLQAVDLRNRLWVSLALGCRRSDGAIALAVFRPEWELRGLRTPGTPVVPDAMFVLADRRGGGETEHTWMVELDAGTERTAVWRAKAEAYGALRGRATFYGADRWRLLAVVPSLRRATSVAAAVVAGGGGAFTYLSVADDLTEGRALACTFYRAADLAASKSALRSASLLLE